MKLLDRLIDAPDCAQGPGIEQMTFRGLKIRPALLQVVQRRVRLGQAIATELGLRLAQRIDGIVAQRQPQDVIVVSFGLVETLDPQTLGGQRNAVGDGIGGASRSDSSRYSFSGSSLLATRRRACWAPGPLSISGTSSTTM